MTDNSGCGGCPVGEILGAVFGTFFGTLLFCAVLALILVLVYRRRLAAQRIAGNHLRLVVVESSRAQRPIRHIIWVISETIFPAYLLTGANCETAILLSQSLGTLTQTHLSFISHLRLDSRIAE